MAYRLTFDEALSVSLRRVAREELHAAADRLADPGDDPVEAVHDARKHLKKTRSLLRLARPDMPRAAFRALNGQLRDRGRALSGTRDADVMVETIDALAERFVGRLPAVAFDAARRPLAERAATVRAEVQAALPEHADALRALASSVEDWPLDGCGAAALPRALGRTYRRGRKALRRVERRPTSENLHDWRKRAKDLWYQERLLRAAWPGVMCAQADEAKALSRLLGDDHDLAVLGDLVSGDATLTAAPATDRDTLRELIAHRRAELQAQARTLGARVYAEPPKAFTRRVATYVELAAAEPEPAAVAH